MCVFCEGLGEELSASGELVLTEGMADPSLSSCSSAGEGSAGQGFPPVHGRSCLQPRMAPSPDPVTAS